MHTEKLSIASSALAKQGLSSRAAVLFAVICVHISVGYGVGSVTPLMEPVTDEFHLGSSERSMLASAVLFGNLFGSPIGGMLADRIGRKSTLMITWMTLIAAMFVEAASIFYSLVFACRMLIGFLTGAHYAAATTYMVEIFDKKTADRKACLVEINFFVGVFLSYALGFGLERFLTNSSMLWRSIALCGAFPAALGFLVLVIACPESETYLANKNLNKRRKEHGTVVSARQESLWSAKTLKLILFVSTFWMASSVPVYCIGAFQISLIRNFGVLLSPHLVNSIMGFAGILGAVIGTNIISKLGLKWTLLSSVIGSMLVFSSLAALSYYTTAPTQLLEYCVIVLLSLFNLLAGVPAPLIFIYPGKIFPSSVKGTASGLCAAIVRLATIIFMFTVGNVVNTLPAFMVTGGTAVFCLFALVLLVFMTPSDKKVDEIFTEFCRLDEEMKESCANNQAVVL